MTFMFCMMTSEGKFEGAYILHKRVNFTDSSSANFYEERGKERKRKGKKEGRKQREKKREKKRKKTNGNGREKEGKEK